MSITKIIYNLNIQRRKKIFEIDVQIILKIYVYTCDKIYTYKNLIGNHFINKKITLHLQPLK